MVQLIATEAEVFEKGLYRIRVQAIELKAGNTTQADGSTKASNYLRWTFDVVEEDFEGKILRANSSTAFGPEAKGRKWAEALLNRSLHPNEPIDTDDLIGLEAIATVGQTAKGDKTYNEIEALAPIRRKPTPKTQPVTSRVQLEGYVEDDEDIPFS